MPTLPNTIDTAIRQTLLQPLVEVLAGQRRARDLESIAAPDVIRRLELRRRSPLGPVRLRTVRAQRVSDRHALELTATLTERGGRVHPLGVRVELHKQRPTIVAIATDLYGS